MRHRNILANEVHATVRVPLRSRKSLVHIAGDAFCGAAFAAALIAMLAYLPPEIDDDAGAEDEDNDAELLESLLWVED